MRAADGRVGATDQRGLSSAWGRTLLACARHLFSGRLHSSPLPLFPDYKAAHARSSAYATMDIGRGRYDEVQFAVEGRSEEAADVGRCLGGRVSPDPFPLGFFFGPHFL